MFAGKMAARGDAVAHGRPRDALKRAKEGKQVEKESVNRKSKHKETFLQCDGDHFPTVLVLYCLLSEERI